MSDYIEMDTVLLLQRLHPHACANPAPDYKYERDLGNRSGELFCDACGHSPAAHAIRRADSAPKPDQTGSVPEVPDR